MDRKKTATSPVLRDIKGKTMIELKYTMLYYIAITVIVLLVSVKLETQYVSECCQNEYRQMTTIDQYNKESTRFYCMECRKWCEIIKGKK